MDKNIFLLSVIVLQVPSLIDAKCEHAYCLHS